MRAVVQRVLRGEVVIGSEAVGVIGKGLVILVGFEASDNASDIAWMTGKLARMRIFSDDAGLMNRSVVDVGGEILVVSQFTLFASYQNGNRPSYLRAARPEQAIPMYELFVQAMSAAVGRPVATGRFGADMQVSLINDGPVTLTLDSRDPE